MRMSETYVIREEPPEHYAYSIVPFRTQMVATHPAENPVIRVETRELWWTCPDGWHESPRFYANQTEQS